MFGNPDIEKIILMLIKTVTIKEIKIDRRVLTASLIFV